MGPLKRFGRRNFRDHTTQVITQTVWAPHPASASAHPTTQSCATMATDLLLLLLLLLPPLLLLPLLLLLLLLLYVLLLFDCILHIAFLLLEL